MIVKTISPARLIIKLNDDSPEVTIQIIETDDLYEVQVQFNFDCTVSTGGVDVADPRGEVFLSMYKLEAQR